MPPNEATSTGGDENMRRYPPNRRPYVQFTKDERKIHARVLGWNENMILVEYPPRIIDKITHGQRDAEWINKSLATRIRRTDSVWAALDDDMGWHELQDRKITPRPDPWTIYAQEFPDTD